MHNDQCHVNIGNPYILNITLLHTIISDQRFAMFTLSYMTAHTVTLSKEVNDTCLIRCLQAKNYTCIDEFFRITWIVKQNINTLIKIT